MTWRQRAAGRLQPSRRVTGDAMKPTPLNEPGDAAVAGAALYSRALLATYDIAVLGVSNRFIWRCPTGELLGWYDAHITGNHLDVGVGTGYFLDHCRFPTPTPRLALLDLNRNSLVATARRMARYAPTTHFGDVLSPFPLAGPVFDSIGLNYLLHCLPGTIESKARAFDNLLPHLAADGVVFGSTILRADDQTSAVARRLMALYNSRRIFSNTADSFEGLHGALEARFADVTVRRRGCVALFSARAPRVHQSIA